MKPIEFSDELFSEITGHLKTYMDSYGGPYYAAFDADGTLWNQDVGEQFFQYQIDNCNLPALAGVNPWEHYHALKEKSPKEAYLWLAQISQGMLFEDVEEWAEEAVIERRLKAFRSQKKLVDWMLDNNMIPLVVTASVKWAVVPAAKLLDIPASNVCGIQTTITTSGKVTNIQDGHITWRKGKVKALLERTEGHTPIFSAGNTFGDTALLNSAKCCALVVQTQTKENGLFHEERKLFEFFRRREKEIEAMEDEEEKEKMPTWFAHHFFDDNFDDHDDTTLEDYSEEDMKEDLVDDLKKDAKDAPVEVADTTEEEEGNAEI